MFEMTPPNAAEIVSYFMRHPSAADSLYGIARWRLLEETLWRRVGEVQEALDWLVNEGFLLRETRPSADPVYRLDPAKLDEARAFLGARAELPFPTLS